MALRLWQANIFLEGSLRPPSGLALIKGQSKAAGRIPQSRAPFGGCGVAFGVKLGQRPALSRARTRGRARMGAGGGWNASSGLLDGPGYPSHRAAMCPRDRPRCPPLPSDGSALVARFTP